MWVFRHVQDRGGNEIPEKTLLIPALVWGEVRVLGKNYGLLPK
jgi:uncharacterized membrane protein YsdA (DUF1294 family)